MLAAHLIAAACLLAVLMLAAFDDFATMLERDDPPEGRTP